MKKSILIVLLVAFLAVAVGVSGCLDNDSNNTTNNTTNNSTTPTFNNSLVQVDPLPANFELLAVKNVTADAENIGGLTDALPGFSGSYMYNNSTSDNVYLYVFECANATDAAGYVLKMIDAHNTEHPNSSNVTTVEVNDHNATLLTTVAQGSSGNERYEMAWNNGNLLVVVNGPAAYNLILAIADASNL